MIIENTNNLKINQKIYRLCLNLEAEFSILEFKVLEIINENELSCSYVGPRGNTDITRLNINSNINLFKLTFLENPSNDIEYFKSAKYQLLKNTLKYLNKTTNEYAFVKRKRYIFNKFSSIYPELFIF